MIKMRGSIHLILNSIHFAFGFVLFICFIASLLIGNFQAAGFLLMMAFGSFLLSWNDESSLAFFLYGVACVWQAIYYPEKSVFILFSLLAAGNFGFFIVKFFMRYKNSLTSQWQKFIK